MLSGLMRQKKMCRTRTVIKFINLLGIITESYKWIKDQMSVLKGKEHNATLEKDYQELDIQYLF